MRRRIIKIDYPAYGGEVELDIDRVIALAPKINSLIFEDTIWKLTKNEFEKAANLWRQYKGC